MILTLYISQYVIHDLITFEKLRLSFSHFTHQAINLAFDILVFRGSVEQFQLALVNQATEQRHFGPATTERALVRCPGKLEHFVELLTRIIQVAGSDFLQQFFGQRYNRFP
ncbi:hypothetical protein D3C79_818210 [compost metagenome]